MDKRWQQPDLQHDRVVQRIMEVFGLSREDAIAAAELAEEEVYKEQGQILATMQIVYSKAWNMLTKGAV